LQNSFANVNVSRENQTRQRRLQSSAHLTSVAFLSAVLALRRNYSISDDLSFDAISGIPIGVLHGAWSAAIGGTGS
jgi:hypothetical protein